MRWMGLFQVRVQIGIIVLRRRGQKLRYESFEIEIQSNTSAHRGKNN